MDHPVSVIKASAIPPDRLNRSGGMRMPPDCLPDCVVVVGDGAAGDGGGGGGGHVGAELGQVGRGDRLQAQRLDGAHLDEQLVEQDPGKN